MTETGATGEAEFDTGWGLGAAFGHDYGTMRAEVEIAYRTNDFDTIKVTSPVSGSVSADGENTSLAFMVNGYYDFENPSSFTPYFTGGVGFAIVEVNFLSVSGPGGTFVIGTRMIRCLPIKWEQGLDMLSRKP